MSNSRRQQGVTLIEVLVSLFILAVGLLGAAALQLNALKYTDSALMSSQASFIAYDMMDRIRANPMADYNLNALADVPSGVTGNDARLQDLHDFKTNIQQFAGSTAEGRIRVVRQQVTISIDWDDARAGGGLQTFSLTSRVAVSPPGVPQ
ncbi:type IV pilus modification protein PilV [Pseudomonas akapageensis]|uniref:type IV pilus modification protein PilV n=1 Tax=Pseudomonas akapageensis TaxID=2609961 RepID=UPI00140AF1E7|nr:type IV pilus modification protein PilV [Pseudomonas akapageensis]